MCQFPIAQTRWANRSLHLFLWALFTSPWLPGLVGWEGFPGSSLSNTQNTVFKQCLPSPLVSSQPSLPTASSWGSVWDWTCLYPWDLTWEPFLHTLSSGAVGLPVTADQSHPKAAWESKQGSARTAPLSPPSFLSPRKRRTYIKYSTNLTLTPASKLRELHLFLNTLQSILIL